MGVFAGIIVVVLAVILVSVPATWLLMLFLGNVGLNLSFWGTLPGAILLMTIGGSSSATKNQK